MKTCKNTISYRKEVMEKYNPTKEDKLRYLDEWRLSPTEPSFVRCVRCSVSKYTAKKRRSKHRTEYGVMCSDCYINLPRCSVHGCQEFMLIDKWFGPYCRKHIMVGEDDPNPPQNRYMIADCVEM